MEALEFSQRTSPLVMIILSTQPVLSHHNGSLISLLHRIHTCFSVNANREHGRSFKMTCLSNLYCRYNFTHLILRAMEFTDRSATLFAIKKKVSKIDGEIYDQYQRSHTDFVQQPATQCSILFSVSIQVDNFSRIKA